MGEEEEKKGRKKKNEEEEKEWEKNKRMKKGMKAVRGKGEEKN